MLDEPEYVCNECEVDMKRLFSRVNISIGNSSSLSKQRDAQKRRTHMSQDLRENYLVHDVQPVAAPNFETVYSDIKKEGSQVRDQMQKRMEITAAQTKAKQNAWKEKASKRVPKKNAEIKERKQKEAAAKRKITIRTSAK
jgi:hypothetical protein